MMLRFSRSFALAAALLSGLALAAPARADRVQVFSIQGADCADCGRAIQSQLRKLKGIKKSEFDMFKVEMKVTLEDQVPDDRVVEAITEAGLKSVVGAGQGSYIPPEHYPPGSDVIVVTEDGSAVGPLEKLRVPGKYTVVDLYADWCGPCRQVDARLRTLIEARQDLAVRKLNVKTFKTPLAKEMGRRLAGLPYVVVFSPDGRRTDIPGLDLARLDAALGAH